MDEDLINLILAGNNYGSGADFLDADGNPYQRADQRFNFIGDILYKSGLSIEDLLGISAPEAPGDAPTGALGTSDLRTTYAGNPLLSEAMDKIDQGVDPITVSAWVDAKIEAEPDLASLLPQPNQTGGFNAPSGPFDGDDVDSILTKYAGESAKIARENTAFQAKQDAYQAEVDAFNAYNSPSSQFEATGSQSVDDIVGGLGVQLPGLSNLGDAKPQVPGFSGPANAPGREPINALTGNFAGLTPSNAPGGPGPSATGSTNRGLAGIIGNVGQDLASSLPASKKATRVPGIQDFGPGVQEGYDPAFESLLNKLGGELVAKRKATEAPSPASQDNVKRLQAAYSLVFGQAPPA